MTTEEEGMSDWNDGPPATGPAQERSESVEDVAGELIMAVFVPRVFGAKSAKPVRDVVERFVDRLVQAVRADERAKVHAERSESVVDATDDHLMSNWVLADEPLINLVKAVRADERAKLESSETMSKVRSAVIVNLEAKITKLRAELAAESDRIAKLEKAHRARLREEAEAAWSAAIDWFQWEEGRIHAPGPDDYLRSRGLED